MDINKLDEIVNEVIEAIMKEKAENAGKIQDKSLSGNLQGEFDTKLSSMMEHSMIRPDATPAIVKQFCEEAVKYKFRNVALAPCFVEMAAHLLKNTDVRVATAVAFPMGIASTRAKVYETLEVIENGATEIDLPLNIGMIKAKELKAIKEEIEAVVKVANKRALIKVVVDLGALTEEERIKVSLIAKMAGADFLKIAATTRPEGLNAEDMKFFRQVIGTEMGLKADGGIKDYKSALAVIEAGGTTIGASGSIKIVSRNG
jgi:deoxyribose-phosphate aldolase